MVPGYMNDQRGLLLKAPCAMLTEKPSYSSMQHLVTFTIVTQQLQGTVPAFDINWSSMLSHMSSKQLRRLGANPAANVTDCAAIISRRLLVFYVAYHCFGICTRKRRCWPVIICVIGSFVSVESFNMLAKVTPCGRQITTTVTQKGPQNELLTKVSSILVILIGFKVFICQLYVTGWSGSSTVSCHHVFMLFPHITGRTKIIWTLSWMSSVIKGFVSISATKKTIWTIQKVPNGSYHSNTARDDSSEWKHFL